MWAIIFYFLILVELALLVISLFGNTLVIFVMMKKKSLIQTSASFYIIAISVADFLTSICAITFAVQGVWVESKLVTM